MGTAPGAIRLVKAGFLVLDVTGATQKIVVFQYNPETLVRRLDPVGMVAPLAAATLPGETVPIGTAGPINLPAPHETVSFTIALDAADKLQAGDAVTQQNGILPQLAALELLLYQPSNTLTVWTSGKRILPVRITGMQILEQMFDPTLNPIRAEVSVTLQVLKDADLPNNSKGRALWDAYFKVLQQLANASLSSTSLPMLGITGI
jgi:hypothetical protein